MKQFVIKAYDGEGKKSTSPSSSPRISPKVLPS